MTPKPTDKQRTLLAKMMTGKVPSKQGRGPSVAMMVKEGWVNPVNDPARKAGYLTITQKGIEALMRK